MAITKQEEQPTIHMRQEKRTLNSVLREFINIGAISKIQLPYNDQQEEIKQSAETHQH